MNFRSSIIITITLLFLIQLVIFFNKTLWFKPHRHRNISNAKTVLVSYTIYPEQWLSAVRSSQVSNCKENLDIFLSNALTSRENVIFVFNFVGQPRHISSRLSELAQKQKNVHVTQINITNNDLASHHETIQKYAGEYSHFILSSCNSRGPYISSWKQYIKDKNDWIDQLISQLTTSIHIISPSINCRNNRPIIQSHALILDKSSIKILIDVLNEKTSTTSEIEYETKISDEMLNSGQGIGFLDPNYQNFDIKFNNVCNKNNNIGNNRKISNFQTLRNSINNKKKLSAINNILMNPCEQLFFIPFKNDTTTTTTSYNYNNSNYINIPSISSKIDSPYAFARPRPNWDISAMWHDILQHKSNKINFNIDKNSKIAIIIRAFDKFALPMISMLAMLKSIENINIRVIIICTDDHSYNILENELKIRKFINDNNTTTTLQNEKFHVSLLDFPASIYELHSPYVHTLCTQDDIKSYQKYKVTDQDISRFCTVNSPLHYLLVDFALHYITEYCISCNQVIVTNADNNYSPLFFQEISKLSPNYDVVMTNMITRGYAMLVEPARSRVDLGAYATSVSFLRRSGVTFLGSAPLCPIAKDYHDLDGLFIENLKSNHAKIVIIPNLFLFFHN